jgi:hypothetical protein
MAVALPLALAALLVAPVSPGPQIRGRVFEDDAPSGPPRRDARAVPEVEVTFSQGGLLQRRRTSASGEFRFRGFDGVGTVAIGSVPADYTVAGSLRVELQVTAGAVAEVNFRVRGHRRVMGRVFLEGKGGGAWTPDTPVFQGVRVVVAGREATTDAEGAYSILDVPAGVQQVALAARSGLPPGFTAVELPSVRVPEKTGHASADLRVRAELSLPPLARPLQPSTPLRAGSQRLRVLPIPSVSRPIAEWASHAEPADQLIAGLEKLAATVMLDDDLRLLLVARTDPRPSGREAFQRALRGISSLQGYLEGPGLVPRSRLIAAVTQAGPDAALGSRDVLDLLLVRVEHDE